MEDERWRMEGGWNVEPLSLYGFEGFGTYLTLH